MLALPTVDLEAIALALSDQTDYEHRWLIDPGTGEIAYWTSDGGLDGENPVDLDDVDLTPIDPLPSWVWYRDMADFVDGISDEKAQNRLGRAIDGRGAFRRFKDELYDRHPDLVAVWHSFRDARAESRAVGWLLDEGLIPENVATEYLEAHPEPELP